MKRLSRILQVLVTCSLITSFANAEDPIKTTIPENGFFKLAELKGGSSTVDLYEQMSALCADNGGKAVFVVPKEIGRYKRLAEVTPDEALDYIVSRLNTDSAWLMSCDGNIRFVVEKNLRSMNRGEETASFYLNRGLEGVNYLASGESVSYAKTVLVEKTPEQKVAFREQMALEVSTMGKDFVKPEDTSRYIGFYNGRYENTSCSHISIKEMDKKETSAVVVYDFKVCNRQVASLGSKVMENTSSMYASFFARP